MLRKHKVIKKVCRDSHPATNGLRTGFIDFKGEHIPIHALSYQDDHYIAHEYQLDKLDAELRFYQDRGRDTTLSTDAKAGVDAKIIELMWKINEATNGAAYWKVFKCLDRPKEWFDKLSGAELDALTVEVALWLMYIDIDEIYMEMYKEILLRFGYNQPKENFTGEQVSKIMKGLEEEYLSLKKKPKCLDTVLRSVKAETVRAVTKSSARDGYKESSEGLVV